MKTTFQVYAFCEGVWRTPAWVFGLDLRWPRDLDAMKANIQKALKDAKQAA